MKYVLYFIFTMVVKHRESYSTSFARKNKRVIHNYPFEQSISVIAMFFLILYIILIMILFSGIINVPVVAGVEATLSSEEVPHVPLVKRTYSGL